MLMLRYHNREVAHDDTSALYSVPALPQRVPWSCYAYARASRHASRTRSGVRWPGRQEACEAADMAVAVAGLTK